MLSMEHIYRWHKKRLYDCQNFSLFITLCNSASRKMCDTSMENCDLFTPQSSGNIWGRYDPKNENEAELCV